MKDKNYNDFKKTCPIGLKSFSLSNIIENKRDNYSGTVELYDILPKYYHYDLDKIRTKDGLLKSLTRNFTYKKQSMVLIISPAQIITEDGEKAFYPSTREEIIEDVLRKFATDSCRNEFLDDRLTVKFTLYDLWKELKKIKHIYSYPQIKESLNILRKTNLEIKTLDVTSSGQLSFSSNMFETFGVINANNREEVESNKDEYNEKVVYFVRFNSLVSESIKNGTWRILNYNQYTKYKKVISRWLHKKISYMVIGGDEKKVYNILLSTIIRDSGMTEYKNISNSIIQVRSCLDEMIIVGSIEKYEVEKRFSKERANKINDVLFSIYVSDSFYSDLKLNFLIKDKVNSKKERRNTVLNENADSIKDIKDDSLFEKEIEELLKNYKLSNREIKKIIKYKNKGKTEENIKQNISSAINYAESERQKGNEFNLMAIITSSIKEDWSNDLFNENKDKSKESNTKDYKNINDIISNISSEDYKNISKEFIKEFGKDIYRAWLLNLEFINLKNKILTLSCDSQFQIDYIARNYLDGIQKVVNGKKIWFRRGIKQIAKDVSGVDNVNVILKK